MLGRESSRLRRKQYWTLVCGVGLVIRITMASCCFGGERGMPPLNPLNKETILITSTFLLCSVIKLILENLESLCLLRVSFPFIFILSLLTLWKEGCSRRDRKSTKSTCVKLRLQSWCGHHLATSLVPKIVANSVTRRRRRREGRKSNVVPSTTWTF